MTNELNDKQEFQIEEQYKFIKLSKRAHCLLMILAVITIPYLVTYM